MAQYYTANHLHFDNSRLEKLAGIFELDMRANINTFSKGMKRQAATILALYCCADYLFMDETMDGLDPIKRNLVKKVVYDDICSRNATAIITSHSLRELEDTCDQLALLHEGRIVFERDIQNLKTSLFNVQLAFGHEFNENEFEEIEIRQYSQKGRVANFIVKGDREKVFNTLNNKSPSLLEILPLSLEEVFIHELDALGYSFDAVLETEEGAAE